MILPLARATVAMMFVGLVASAQNPAPQNAGPSGSGARELFVRSGKSVVVDSPVPIQRISVANDAVANAVATSPREVLINGKGPGETSLIIWQQNGQRQFFDVVVDTR